MKRSPLRRSRTAIPRKTRVKKVNRVRQKENYARCFHSRARVLWVKAQPCVLTGGTGEIDNAHIPGAKGAGAGRRGDYDQIVPLWHKAHRLLHQNPAQFFSVYGAIDWPMLAARTQAAWLAFRGAQDGDT